MPYAKADFFVDIDTFLIHDFILRVKPRHDTIGAKTFFKRCSYKNIFVPMDKAYDSEPLHELAEQKGIISYAPVRNFCVRKPRGKHRRRCFQERPERASRRCLIESTIRSLKSCFRTLRSRKHFLKKRELGWQVLVYNLRILAKNAKAFLELLYQATILNRAAFLALQCFFQAFKFQPVTICHRFISLCQFSLKMYCLSPYKPFPWTCPVVFYENYCEVSEIICFS